MGDVPAEGALPAEGAPPAEVGAHEGVTPAAPGPPMLTIDPPTATVPASGGQSSHQVANPSGVRLVFKVS